MPKSILPRQTLPTLFRLVSALVLRGRRTARPPHMRALCTLTYVISKSGLLEQAALFPNWWGVPSAEKQPEWLEKEGVLLAAEKAHCYV
jgi:hypothetical protein